MPDFELIDVDELPYFYLERTCSMDPQVISTTMGQTFKAVAESMQANGIALTGKGLSVYYSYDPDQVTFRAGFTVAPEAAAKAKEPIRYAVTPAGQVLYFRHKGPYATLRDSYAELMAYLEREGLTLGAPTWEVYLNDPETTPEAELLTDIFVSLG